VRRQRSARRAKKRAHHPQATSEPRAQRLL